MAETKTCPFCFHVLVRQKHVKVMAEWQTGKEYWLWVHQSAEQARLCKTTRTPSEVRAA